ncbi:DUF1292 domain-containing protein [Cohnella zeiphila]|uniref:DUF1292 domain-containing protein n=1 Tax=Cohnella zeiphila TaxID=2761120 RepID=A0A7X0SUK9_9BACL|nr:DUF1292 domain-containing protein [Cohnella zeiphila]MBB6735434.1 DUF1292 domain-containing protein [Cohnella zeiphila]
MSGDYNDRTDGDRAGSLRQAFGPFVELEDEDGNSVRCRILAELSVGGHEYAIVQSDAQRKDGDIEVLRISADERGMPQLEAVEDDEEWENAAEAYDDLQFGSDEQP